MPYAAPRICSCGIRVAHGLKCACQIERDRERKARFDQTRPSASKRGYDRNWRAESKTFLRANPTCARCPAPGTVVDHVMAHKGNMKLFWNKANWQPLCKPCHDRHKQREERRS